MPEPLALNDIVQQYSGCVILYKGKPHKVKNVGAQVQLLDLHSMRKKMVDFDQKDFAPPLLRLGYVNIDNTSVYVSRKPARLYQVGINQNNFIVSPNKRSLYDGDINEVVKKVIAMEVPEFADMMLGHYPTLQSALKNDNFFRSAGSIAFDKQFAIDSGCYIYYKGTNVGRLNGSEKIVFNKGMEYLGILLENGYEKATRTFSQKAA